MRSIVKYRAFIALLVALCFGFITACSEEPTSISSREQLTYDEILGTGLANSCPQLPETARDAIELEEGASYSIRELCLQPTSFFVQEEPANKRQEAEFVPAKPLTRYTTSLEKVQGQLKQESDGSLTFIEEDGIDFQPITVQLPGGEQVPFLFTIKSLVASSQPNLTALNTSTNFEGQYRVPPYRTAGFQDTKGRGGAAGYDNALALPAKADADEYTRANVKQYEVQQGKIALKISKVDASTNEIAGIFESEQPSETDMGAKEPFDVKVRGVFYGIVESTAESS